MGRTILNNVICYIVMLYYHTQHKSVNSRKNGLPEWLRINENKASSTKSPIEKTLPHPSKDNERLFIRHHAEARLTLIVFLPRRGVKQKFKGGIQNANSSRKTYRELPAHHERKAHQGVPGDIRSICLRGTQQQRLPDNPDGQTHGRR